MSNKKYIADLEYLYEAMLERFSYYQTANDSIDFIFEEAKRNVNSVSSIVEFGLMIQKMLARFKDGHAGINVKPSPQGYLPFLLGAAGDKLVAFKEDRSDFLDTSYPFLTAIDGIDISKWLVAARLHVPRGSEQYIQFHSLLFLRAIQMLRSDMGHPVLDHAILTLQNSRGRGVTRNITISPNVPQHGIWPRNESELIEEKIGYIRIERMKKGINNLLKTTMLEFKNTKGLIIDVRGNGGGSRECLTTLFPYFMTSNDKPRVVNVAAYRSSKVFPEDHLVARSLYRFNSLHWNKSEKKAIEKCMQQFKPELTLDTKLFSDWHYFVVSSLLNSEITYYYNSPVVILSDARCFSATDIFLSAFKGWRNVTIIGQSSSGGSARAQILELPNTGYKVRFASMASFNSVGILFDGNGVEPDIHVDNDPSFYLIGGKDNVLEKALLIVNG